MRFRTIAVLALVLSFGLVAGLAAQARSWAAAEPDMAKLVEDLRQGGYVIFVRHAGTNWQEEGKEESMRASGRLDLEELGRLPQASSVNQAHWPLTYLDYGFNGITRRTRDISHDCAFMTDERVEE